MRKTLLLLSSAVIAITACRRETEPGEREAKINFTTEITAPTRVADDLFENGDNIIVSAIDEASENFAQNVKYSYTDGKFNSSSAITKSSEADKLKFTAMYPAGATLENEFEFSVFDDQNSGDNFENSDLLIAQTSLTEALTPKLTFKHALSTLEINFKLSTGEEFTPDEITIFGQGTANCNISENTYSANGADNIEITPKMMATSAKAVVAPQTIKSGDEFIILGFGDEYYTKSFTDDMVIKSGYIYEFDFTVNPETGEVTIDLIDATIDDWFDEEL